MRSQMPLAADGYYVPIWNMGSDITLWAKTQKKSEPYQRALRKMAEESPLGYVDEHRLSDEGNQWVVVVSPSEFLTYLVGGVNIKDFVYIYSSYFPYSDKDKMFVSENYRWVCEHFSPRSYFADFFIRGSGESCMVTPVRRDDGLIFHVSGHAAFDVMTDKIILPLLDGNYKGKQLVLTHGDSPDVWKRAFMEKMSRPQLIEKDLYEYVQYLNKRIGLKFPSDLRIHSHLPRYNPKDPLSNDIHSPLPLKGIFTLQID